MPVHLEQIDFDASGNGFSFWRVFASLSHLVLDKQFEESALIAKMIVKNIHYFL
jgi:hypothetical protein